MPEIKNNFTQGKMNKDLDERLIPNGQYRDALNIEITTSEDDSAGVIQNIVGNTRVDSVNNSANAVCVGSVADEKNNKLYWFVKATGFNGAYPERDAIIEYDVQGKTTSFVVVDLKGEARYNAPFLKFSGKYITAINVVDQYLAWTDGETEPKKINIEKCKAAQKVAGNDFSHHSYLHVNGAGTSSYLKEENITVIKKRPMSAPVFEVTSAANPDYDKEKNPSLVKDAIFEKIFPRFCLRYKYQDGEYSAFGPFTNVVFNPEYTGSYNKQDFYTAKEPFNTAMINTISSVSLYGLITPDMPKDVVQVDILYKAENSSVIYSVGSITTVDDAWRADSNWFQKEGLADYDSYNPTTRGVYVITTENIHKALPDNQFLRPWDNVPKKAVAQEVSGNRIVYGNYTQGYDLKFQPIVSADYGDRAIAGNYSYPKTSFSFAEEFGSISNNTDPRIYTGEATPGYTIEAEYYTDREGKIVITKPAEFVPGTDGSIFRWGALPSLKTQRDYQVGVVFGDEYGRETPVFTSDKATVKIPWSSQRFGNPLASSLLSLNAALGNNAPDWASYYKFYVKQSSGEYYNLAMDKAYQPADAYPEYKNENQHIYVSFSSSDRNKLQEGDYIVMKKIVGETEAAGQVPYENRYKVLDIANEMPEAIAFEFLNQGVINNSADILTVDATSGELNKIFPSNPVSNEDERIDRLTSTIKINKGSWLDANGVSLTKESQATDITDSTGDIYISWRKVKQTPDGQPSKTIHSKRYKCVSVRLTGDVYTLNLQSPIIESDAQIAAVNNDLSVKNALLAGADASDLLYFQVEKKVRKDKEDFSGKFFVKISTDDALKKNILSDWIDISSDFYVTAKVRTFYLADATVSNHDATSGIVNSDSSALVASYIDDSSSDDVTDITGGGLTNTRAKWQSFITNASFGERLRTEADNLSSEEPSTTSANSSGWFIDAMYFAGANSDTTNSFAKYSGQAWTGNIYVEYPDIEWGRVIDFSYRATYQGVNTGGTGTSSGANRDWLVEAPPFTNGRIWNVAAKKSRYGWREAGKNETDNDNWNISTSRHSGPTINGVSAKYYRNWNHGDFSTWQRIDDRDASTKSYDEISEVNGLEGILARATGKHYAGGGRGEQAGPRVWLGDKQFYGKYPNGRNSKATYSNGPSYIHLSFLGCGGALFDKSKVPSNVSINGEFAIGKYLQGIHGGGAFTNQAGTSLGSSNFRFVEMEGSTLANTLAYTSDGEVAPLSGDEDTVSPGILLPRDRKKAPSTGNSDSFGYNKSGNFEEEHNRQWEPGKRERMGDWGNGKVFANENLLIGKQFRFNNDDSEELYTILDKTELHLYNHTPWKARQVWTGDGYAWGNDSVEEAVAAWADTANADGQPVNDLDAEFGIMLDRLEDFGHYSNRRVCYQLALDKNPLQSSYNPVLGGVSQNSQVLPTSTVSTDLQFISNNPQVLTGELTKNPVIWETEPKELTELNIYYEASNAIPTRLNRENLDLFAPQGSRVEFPNISKGVWSKGYPIYLRKWNGPSSDFWDSEDGTMVFEVRGLEGGSSGARFEMNGTDIKYAGQEVRFYRHDGSYTTGVLGPNQQNQNYYDEDGNLTASGAYWRSKNVLARFEVKAKIDPTKQVGLSWFNSYIFGDGLESNRIRDDFNEMTMTNGARVSTTLEEPYKEEHKKNGLIYSGLYNSNSSLNNLNQFIQAEKITKDINPTYGSIQKLFSRSSDLIALCEDRVIKILANKDAVFNADGNPQLIASSNVLGQATPFSGDYGISKNPESFASESYRAYFTDKQRGAVLRLSMDGLTPISDAGMHDYFRDSLTTIGTSFLGTYDDYKKEYNLTIKEAHYQNQIQNNLFDEGEVLIQSILSQEVLPDGQMAGGVDYTSVDIANDIYYSSATQEGAFGQGPLVPLNNRTFGYKAIVRNWPAITAGSIRPFAAEVPLVNTTNNTYTASADADNGQPLFTLNFEAATANPFVGHNGTHSVYGTNNADASSSISRTINGVVNPTGSNGQYTGTNDQTETGIAPYEMGQSGQTINTWTRAYGGPGAAGNGHAYSNIFFDSGSNFTQATSSESAGTADGVQQGIAFTNMFFGMTDGQAANNRNNYITVPGYSSHAPTSQIPADITGWDNNVNNTTGQQFDDVIYNHAGFAGEEFYVRFDATIPSENGDYAYDWFVQLIGDGELISNNYITTTDTNTVTEGDSAQQVGFNTLSTAIIPAHPEYDANKLHRVYFKLKTVDQLIADGILPSDYPHKSHQLFSQVKIRVGVTGNGGGGTYPDGVIPHSYLNRLYFRKTYSLTKPGRTFQEFVAEQAQVPLEDRPAWAEVIYDDYLQASSYSWGSNQTASVNKFYNGEQQYGLANLGTWQTTVLADNSSVEWYDFAGGNGVTAHYSYGGQNSFEGSTPSEYVTTPNGGSLPSFNQYTEAVDPLGAGVSNGIRINHNAYDAANPSSVYLTQTLGSDEGYKVGHWYCVDVYYDENHVSEQAGSNAGLQLLIPGVVGAQYTNAKPFTHTDENPNYPPYHFGQVSGGVNSLHKSMLLMPAVNNEFPLSPGRQVLRTVFQYNPSSSYHASNSNIFTIQGWVTDVVIDVIMLYDITQAATMTKPNRWNAPDYSWQGIHALSEFITDQTSYDLSPEAYYKQGMLCFKDAERSDYWNNAHYYDEDLLYNIEESYDGYRLEFTIAENPDTETIDGNLDFICAGPLRTLATGGSATEGFVVKNIDTVGDYNIIVNFNDNTPTIVSAPDGSNVTATALSAQTEFTNLTSQNASKAVFRPQLEGFTGAVDSVSIKDITQYYTGGGIDSWNITGFDRSGFDYIAWNNENKNVVFVEAEESSDSLGIVKPVQIEQRINEQANSGENVFVSFTKNLTSGGVKGYYYNSEGKGFTFSTSSSGSSFSTSAVVEALRPSSAYLVNTLVIQPNNQGGSLTNGSIDNIVFKKAAQPSFTPDTVSFSESAQGWTSRKSFIPEEGVSVAKKYFTMKNGAVWQHYTSEFRNVFYNNDLVNPTPYPSTVEAILNQSPSSVKNFNTINYEGSQSRVLGFTQLPLYDEITGELVKQSDISTYNAFSGEKQGWHLESIQTDMQAGSIEEFIEKEGKWFNYIGGLKQDDLFQDVTDKKVSQQIGNLNFQGIGVASSVSASNTSQDDPII